MKTPEQISIEDAEWQKKKERKNKIKDSLTWIGFLLICLIACSWINEHFGETIVYIAMWPVIFVGVRIYSWWNKF